MQSKQNDCACCWAAERNHLLFLRDEQRALQEKLASLEKKIIVGGENLLEKAELQARLLAESEKELEARLQKETELKKRLVEREVGHSILRKSKFLCFILDFFIFFI